MSIISRRVHGWFDYIVAVLLIASPWMLGFSTDPFATGIPVVLGISTIIYSLLTKYEMGLVKVIPVKTHLTLDLVSGIVLILSPLVFAFAGYVWKPHVIAGAIEIIIVLLTQTPSRKQPKLTTIREKIAARW